MTLIPFNITSVKYHFKLLSAKFLLPMISLKWTLYNYLLNIDKKREVITVTLLVYAFFRRSHNCRSVFRLSYLLKLNEATELTSKNKPYLQGGGVVVPVAAKAAWIKPVYSLIASLPTIWQCTKNTWYKLTHSGESRVYRVIIHK